jgi:quinol monooxygenase YgiN
MVSVALYVRLQAKLGKEQDVENFLRSGLAIVQEEPATIAWFAIKMGPSTFGIFDAFPDEAGRQAHLSGRVAGALMASAADLPAEAPKIENIEVLAAKLPSTIRLAAVKHAEDQDIATWQVFKKDAPSSDAKAQRRS